MHSSEAFSYKYTHSQRDTHRQYNMHLQFPIRTNRSLEMSATAAMIFQNPCMKSMSKHLLLSLVRNLFPSSVPFLRITFPHISQHYSSFFHRSFMCLRILNINKTFLNFHQLCCEYSTSLPPAFGTIVFNNGALTFQCTSRIASENNPSAYHPLPRVRKVIGFDMWKSAEIFKSFFMHIAQSYTSTKENNCSEIDVQWKNRRIYELWSGNLSIPCVCHSSKLLDSMPQFQSTNISTWRLIKLDGFNVYKYAQHIRRIKAIACNDVDKNSV